MKSLRKQSGRKASKRSADLFLLGLFLLATFYGVWLLIESPHRPTSGTLPGSPEVSTPRNTASGIFPNYWDLRTWTPAEGTFPHGVVFLLVIAVLITAYFGRLFQRRYPDLTPRQWLPIHAAALIPVGVSFFTVWMSATPDAPVTGWTVLLLVLSVLLGLMWSGLFASREKGELIGESNHELHDVECAEIPFLAVGAMSFLTIFLGLAFPAWL